jgi:hypothetical protein
MNVILSRWKQNINYPYIQTSILDLKRDRSYCYSYVFSIAGSIVYSWVTFTGKPSTTTITQGTGSSITTLDNRKGTHNIV